MTASQEIRPRPSNPKGFDSDLAKVVECQGIWIRSQNPKGFSSDLTKITESENSVLKYQEHGFDKYR